MPIYQYACQDCGTHFEKRQSFSDQPIKRCYECQGQVERVISSVGIIFKGSGFYINDSKNGNGNKNNGSSGKKSKLNTPKKETAETPSSSESAAK